MASLQKWPVALNVTNINMSCFAAAQTCCWIESRPTDQGAVYASKIFRQTLESFGFRVSMSRKGHCWDNAYMESFYHTLKTEMVYFMRFKHLAEAIAHIMDYIRYYNRDRLHSGLGYITPLQMAKLVA